MPATAVALAPLTTTPLEPVSITAVTTVELSKVAGFPKRSLISSTG